MGGNSSSDTWKEEHCLVLVLLLLGVSDYIGSLLNVGITTITVILKIT